MHVSHAASTASRYRIDAYAALVVQAGTATSTRGRGEVNSFNLLRVEHERVEIDRYGWDALTSHFRIVATEKFVRSGNVWAPAVEGMLAAGL
jgi:hypothetical protein